MKLRKLRRQNNEGRIGNGGGRGTQVEEGHLDKEKDERAEERHKRENREPMRSRRLET